MNCPNCGQAMVAHVLPGHHGATVALDMCMACHLFWFDTHESLQLAPASTLRLFRLIGEDSSSRRPLAAQSKCPRCQLILKLVHDMQRTTKFQYRKCLRGHGRLITFFDFLREKNFLKPMSAEQIEELRRNLDTVNCSNCGAAIDLTHSSACQHCGSALSVLDMTQAEKLVAELRAADRTGQPIDPALPLRLEQAKRETIEALKGVDEAEWYNSVSASDVVAASLQSLAKWLKSGA